MDLGVETLSVPASELVSLLRDRFKDYVMRRSSEIALGEGRTNVRVGDVIEAYRLVYEERPNLLAS